LQQSRIRIHLRPAHTAHSASPIYHRPVMTVPRGVPRPAARPRRATSSTFLPQVRACDLGEPPRTCEESPAWLAGMRGTAGSSAQGRPGRQACPVGPTCAPNVTAAGRPLRRRSSRRAAPMALARSALDRACFVVPPSAAVHGRSFTGTRASRVRRACRRARPTRGPSRSQRLGAGHPTRWRANPCRRRGRGWT